MKISLIFLCLCVHQEPFPRTCRAPRAWRESTFNATVLTVSPKCLVRIIISPFLVFLVFFYIDFFLFACIIFRFFFLSFFLRFSCPVRSSCSNCHGDHTQFFGFVVRTCRSELMQYNNIHRYE